MFYITNSDVYRCWSFAWRSSAVCTNVVDRGRCLFLGGRTDHEELVRANQSSMTRDTSCICFLYKVRLRYCDVYVFKMLNILSRCKKVAPSLLRAQMADFMSVCPAIASRGYSWCSLRLLTGTVVSSRRCCRAQASGTKRYYSENDTHSNVDVFQRESLMTDTDSSQSK